VVKGIPRWAFAVVAVVVVAIAADAAVFVATGPKKAAGPPRPPSEGVAVIDAHDGRVVDHLLVGSQPTEVMSNGGAVWVLNKSDGSVSRIDTRTRHVVSTIRPPEPADGMTLGDGSLWLTGHGLLRTFTPGNPHGTTTIRRLDTANDAVMHTVRLKTGGALIAEGAGELWTTGFVDGDVRRGGRADAATGTLSVLDDRVFGDLIAADGNSAYYVTSLGARVQRVDSPSGRLIKSLSLADVHDLIKGKLPPNPTGLTVADGSLWLSQTDGTVLRIDLALKRVDRTIKVCKNAVAIGAGDGAVWAACGEGTAVRIDPATDAAGTPVALGSGLPRGIAAGGGSVWVTIN
jgi:DNA-binding beta-propeller fold protein YncE